MNKKSLLEKLNNYYLWQKEEIAKAKELENKLIKYTFRIRILLKPAKINLNKVFNTPINKVNKVLKVSAVKANNKVNKDFANRLMTLVNSYNKFNNGVDATEINGVNKVQNTNVLNGLNKNVVDGFNKVNKGIQNNYGTRKLNNAFANRLMTLVKAYEKINKGIQNNYVMDYKKQNTNALNKLHTLINKRLPAFKNLSVLLI